VNLPEHSEGGTGRRLCQQCQTELPVSFLACPSCAALVHAEQLKALATEAAQSQREGKLEECIEIWSRMLALLPASSVQHTRISQTLTETQQRLPAKAEPAPTTAPRATSRTKKRTGILVGLGTLGVLLLKFKWALLFLLGKGKLLLFGLLKAKTFLSMALALGVYTAAWGWKFAAGLIVSIYIHEMGHVAWLRRYGIAATAPMFIPGVGAFVRLRQSPRNPAEDARVGLAGPLWGLCAALGFLVVGLAVPWKSWIAIASVGAWINMFNLLPVWQLDGGRAWNALSRPQRGWACAALCGLALLAGDGLYFLIAGAGVLRALGGKAPEQGDRGALTLYVALAAILTLIMHIARAAVPMGGPAGY
jgi:Zn-dependent protease